MTDDEAKAFLHKERHEHLHAALDELLADYIAHHPGALPSQMSAMELLTWSHEQTISPTPTPGSAEHLRAHVQKMD